MSISNFFKSLLYEDSFNIGNFYTNQKTLLIYDGIIEPNVNSKLSSKELVSQWINLNFTNLKNNDLVITDSSIMFEYVNERLFLNSNFGTKLYPWFIKVVISLKDEKVHISYFDSGNCLIEIVSGSYIERKTRFLSTLYTISNTSKWNVGLISLKESLINNCNSLNNFIKSQV
jgi:hypothetical protein